MKRRDFLKGLAVAPLAAVIPAAAEEVKPVLYCMDASGGPDRTVAYLVRWCPITDQMLHEPVSAEEFYDF